MHGVFIIPPRGTARGKERPQGLSGGVGGVLGIGKIKQDLNQTTNFEPCGRRKLANDTL